MSENKPPLGSIGWVDQTSPIADHVKSFYEAVVGWTSSPVSMGDYDDYSMIPPGGEMPVAGICHARGGNADLPVGWLIYIIVADLDASLAACKEHGGALLAGPKTMGTARYAIIKDPAGAVSGLYQL